MDPDIVRGLDLVSIWAHDAIPFALNFDGLTFCGFGVHGTQTLGEGFVETSSPLVRVTNGPITLLCNRLADLVTVNFADEVLRYHRRFAFLEHAC